MEDRDRLDWRLFEEGDQTAFERIFQRHRGHLLKYCSYMTGSHAAGEDVVQETFIRLLEQKGALTIRSSLKDWLFICARNHSLNLLAKRRRTEQSPPPVAGNDDCSGEMKWLIREILEKLNHDERDMILMREQQQYTIVEMATLLGINQEAVRVRLFRIRKKMCELGKRYR
jgi:RNA polymerase sigma-70 factor, ECF subfamily